MNVPEALATVLAHTAQLEATSVPLGAALGRALREAARADADSPRFDASAMDGYAARRSDLAAPLRLVGESAAGGGFAGTLGRGECVRIFTGAPVPAGADCVIKQEDTTCDGGTVHFTGRGETPHFIRRRGENRRAGDVIIPAGTVLGPAELAALATAGITRPTVTRAPRVAHLLTGNELVPPEATPAGAQIRDSNSSLIAGLLAQHGAELTGHARAGDELAAAQAATAALPEHDVLLISGGASVGDHDFARPLLRALGYTLHFEQLNLRPGRPLVFASRGRQLAFALPGNPVSHWVTFQLFVAPLLRKLQTGIDPTLPRLSARLAVGGRAPAPDARHTFWPSRTVIVDGGFELTPLALASSGDSGGLVGANALLVLPEKRLDPGQRAEFIPCA